MFPQQKGAFDGVESDRSFMGAIEGNVLCTVDTQPHGATGCVKKKKIKTRDLASSYAFTRRANVMRVFE